MPVTVIVGGQYGSEGKGKVAHHLAIERNAAVAVRTGGTNSGHTVIDNHGAPIVLRQLPTAALIQDVLCVLGAGSYVDPEILFREISQTGLSERRLLIDPNALVITEQDKESERASGLRESIGSTQSGTGAAVTKRIGRKAEKDLAKNDSRLSRFIEPASKVLRTELAKGRRIILEGTQGFGLSPLHSSAYPYVTSRDTTAAAFVSEAGLSPLDVDEIVLVLRAFPIRVSGTSGPLPNEVTWESITVESGSPSSLLERTSVTKTVRRVAKFNPEIVRAAIEVNAPTHLVLNHLDYVDYTSRQLNSPTQNVIEFIQGVEFSIGMQISFFGFGPSSLVTRKHFQFKVHSAV